MPAKNSRHHYAESAVMSRMEASYISFAFSTAMFRAAQILAVDSYDKTKAFKE